MHRFPRGSREGKKVSPDKVNEFLILLAGRNIGCFPKASPRLPESSSNEKCFSLKDRQLKSKVPSNFETRNPFQSLQSAGDALLSYCLGCVAQAAREMMGRLGLPRDRYHGYRTLGDVQRVLGDRPLPD